MTLLRVSNHTTTANWHLSTRAWVELSECIMQSLCLANSMSSTSLLSLFVLDIVPGLSWQVPLWQVHRCRCTWCITNSLYLSSVKLASQIMWRFYQEQTRHSSTQQRVLMCTYSVCFLKGHSNVVHVDMVAQQNSCVMHEYYYLLI